MSLNLPETPAEEHGTLSAYTKRGCRCDHRWRNDRDHIAHVAAEVRAAVGRERDGGGEG
jgi:hypothetical protein